MDENKQAGADTKANNSFPKNYIRVSGKFADINKLIARDLNNNRNKPTFHKYTKDDIEKYIANPYEYEKQLRRAIDYVFSASGHFRRLIQYFAGLTNWAYIVEPYRLDTKSANVRMVYNNYRRVLNVLTSMNINTQFLKVLMVCLKYDVYYGTLWVSNDTITLQQLPADYSAITTVEGNVPNVTFNFSYFDTREYMLDFYPAEFRTKYETIYKKDKAKNKWIELDSPTSFAIKCNSDILEYPVPPFAGILREVFDLEDYRGLKQVKAALENYAMISMRLPLDDTGAPVMEDGRAESFFDNLDAVLPEEIGAVLTPMDLDKISFERTHTGDTNNVAEAEQALFTAAGVSSLLFNNEKASANALLLSIKADQEITFGIVKSIGDAINRFLQAQSYGKNFRVNFLNVSCFNAKEAGDAYLKAASYGIPTISAYAASQGIGQAELDGMSFLETKVLELQNMFTPLVSSTQLSSDSLNTDGNGATDEGGAPTKGVGEITDSGETSQEGQ